MLYLILTVLFDLVLLSVQNLLEGDFMAENEIKIEHYVFWPNATIPFYIDPQHFDHEQSNTILTALAMLAFKSCLKLVPALTQPTGDQHILVFHNPTGVRQCELNVNGHSREEPHYMVLGYDCLQTPKIEMMLMKALGFGFEHNRAIRDLYVSVQKENIDPSAMELFTMDDKLPAELRALPYDVNSATHFDEREYSKNGHRTIIILDHKVRQNRVGLSDTDVRKINIVYGPECRKRDRQEKIDLCQGYPGVARRKRDINALTRRKRDVDASEVKSLRVNPNITPPPEVLNDTGADIEKLIEEYGIKDGVEEIKDLVFKVGSVALTNTRKKYCNSTENATTEVVTSDLRRSEDKKPDILGVVENVAEFVKDMVDHALSNLTAFCETENDFRAYQRARCPFYSGGGGGGSCNMFYRSTKHGPVMYSTQHRPWIVQSTKHVGGRIKNIMYHQGRRQNDEPAQRRKREVGADGSGKIEPASVTENKATEKKFEGRRYNVRTLKPDRWEDSDVTLEKKNEIKETRKHEIILEERLGKQRGRLAKVPKAGRSHTIPETVELTKKNKEFYGERRWPLGIVKYVITNDETFDLEDVRARLEAVIGILRQRTCVRMQEVSEEEAQTLEDYLVLDASADYITGRVGGRQHFGSLELFEGGQHKQHAAMMVMAMLGFYFELARHDRDAYVRVHMRHVRADKLHHFEKIRSDATLAMPYDYESATHPAWQFWRKIGKTGISTVATYKEKDPDGSIMRSLGQHDKLLSEMDIIKINTVYGVKCFMEHSKANKKDDEAKAKHKRKDKPRDRDTEDQELEKYEGDTADPKTKDNGVEEEAEEKEKERKREKKEHTDNDRHDKDRDRHSLKKDDDVDDDRHQGRDKGRESKDDGRHGRDRDRELGEEKEDDGGDDRHGRDRNREHGREKEDENNEDVQERERKNERETEAQIGDSRHGKNKNREREREDERDDHNQGRHIDHEGEKEEQEDDGRHGRDFVEDEEEGRHENDREHGRDRHRNKHEPVRDEEMERDDESISKNRHKRPDYDANEDREDQERIKGRNKIREENEYGRHKNKGGLKPYDDEKRDRERERDNDEEQDRGRHGEEAKIEIDEERHRNKNRDRIFKEMGDKRHERRPVRNKYEKESGLNRYQIKNREERDRNRHRERDVKGREWAKEQYRLREAMEEEENRKRNGEKLYRDPDREEVVRDRDRREKEEEDFRGSDPSVGREMREVEIKWPDKPDPEEWRMQE